tara:strand:+ start:2296 stop:2469 length:174 start_codon:yes stop_codon:yes gene_type:complete
MIERFKEIENRVFSAPYKWLIRKGYIVAKRVYLTMDDLYQTKVLDSYRGNPNFPGDD